MWVDRGIDSNPTSRLPPTPTGSVVTFGTDAPVRDVESFVGTVTSASLVPQGGGTVVPLITSTVLATVEFAISWIHQHSTVASSVPAGTYMSLQVTLTNPQLVVINSATIPPVRKRSR